MASGKKYNNNSLLTNRLWLILSYKEDEHLSSHSKIAYNKVFGQPVVVNGTFDGFGQLQIVLYVIIAYFIKRAKFIRQF